MAASRPTSTPQTVPAMNAARRPWRRAIAPAGRMQAAMPTTKIDSGSVARALSGASRSPTMAPVAYTTTELAPASACAAVRRAMLPRCSRGDSACAGSLGDADKGVDKGCLLFEQRCWGGMIDHGLAASAASMSSTMRNFAWPDFMRR